MICDMWIHILSLLAVCRRHSFSFANFFCLACLSPGYICPGFAHIFSQFSSWFIFILVSHIVLWKSFAKLHLTFRARCERREWERQSQLFKFSVRFFSETSNQISPAETARALHVNTDKIRNAKIHAAVQLPRVPQQQLHSFDMWCIFFCFYSALSRQEDVRPTTFFCSFFFSTSTIFGSKYAGRWVSCALMAIYLGAAAAGTRLVMHGFNLYSHSHACDGNVFNSSYPVRESNRNLFTLKMNSAQINAQFVFIE